MKFGLEENILEKIIQVFEANSKVDKALIVGSRAKGNYRPDSDIDVVVKGYDLVSDDIIKMNVAFQASGINYIIDLIDYNSLKESSLVEHIDCVGIEFYSCWKIYKLGEFINVINGFSFKSENFLDCIDDDSLPIIKIKNVANGDVNLNDVQFHLYSKNLSKYVIDNGDVLISLTGNHPEIESQVVGLVSKYKLNCKAFLNQRVAKVVSKNEKILSNEYIYYFLKDVNTHNYLASQSSGSANQANISKSDIENISITIPPFSERFIIASILSSLDDKIDLLQRQNKTLEQLAETFFKQRFIEETDESWEEAELDKYVFFDPKEKLERNKPCQFFEMKCLSNVDMNISEGIQRIISSASSFRNMDTLLAKITPCLENGKTGFVMHLNANEIARGSTEFIVMRSKGLVSPYWIYCLARNSDFRDNAILSMTGTSGRQRVQIDLLKSIKVKVDKSRMDEFHKTVDPFFKKIKSNQTQIRTITQLRDTLLPKLISGEVRVKF